MSTHISSSQDVSGEVLPDTVSVKLLTKTGLGVTLLMFISALVDAIAGETIDADTRLMIAGGVATTIATILARAYQQGKLWAAKSGIDLPDRPLR